MRMKARHVAGWAAILGGAALASPALAGAGDAPVATATFRSYDAKGCVATEVTLFAIGSPGAGAAKLDLVATRVDECQGKDLLAAKSTTTLGSGAFSVSPDLGTATLVAAVQAPGRAGRDATVNVRLTWTATEPALEADTSVSPTGLGRWSRAPVHRVLRVAEAAGTVSDGVGNLTPVAAADATLSLTRGRAAGAKG
jgi:hypothetical protein